MNITEVIQTQMQQLSKSQKKVASYILDHPREVALNSAQELGEASGVSETTVIRFCYSLAYSGYTELQKAVREQLLAKESSLGAYRQEKVELGEQPHFLARVMEQDRIRIAETAARIGEQEYEAAVKRLSEAGKVYVLGLRSSFSAANWLSYAMGLVRDDVRLIRPDTEDIIRTVTEMDSGSVLVVISFHRYLIETLKIVELAKERGCFIVAITDSPAAPVQPLSDVLFSIHSPNKSTLDATASLFSFLNALVAGLLVRGGGNFQRRQEEYRKLDDDFLFVERTE